MTNSLRVKTVQRLPDATKSRRLPGVSSAINSMIHRETKRRYGRDQQIGEAAVEPPSSDDRMSALRAAISHLPSVACAWLLGREIEIVDASPLAESTTAARGSF